MNYSWNWGVLFADPYIYWLVNGTLMTIAISLSAWIIALALGGTMGVLHSLPNRILRSVATLYISIFRNIPLLLQMFIWYFVVPELVPEVFGTWLKRGMPFPEVTTGIIALALFTSARVAVQVSSGISSLPAGQKMAAVATGMSIAQTYRHVLLPQGFRIILPPLTSEFLTIFKNSSIALAIGVYELTAQTQQIQSYTYQGFEAYTAATIIYVSIALAVTFVMRRIEWLAAIPGTRASA